MGIRVIPRLEIKGSNVVKGIHLEGLRVLGSPNEFAESYYLSGADELLYVDVVASLYERNSLLQTIEQTAMHILIPLTVAGGIRSIADIRSALLVGADKVALNTAAIKRPDFISEAANRFGSSTIVVSIEAKRQSSGKYEAYTDGGRERTGLDALSWARQVATLGAGEILLTSIDREGTGTGFDIELTEAVAQAVPIPVIACGGAGRPEHIRDVIVNAHADAVAVSSLLHYSMINRIGKNGSSTRLVSGGTPELTASHIHPIPLAELKQYLRNNGVACRPAEYDVQ